MATWVAVGDSPLQLTPAPGDLSGVTYQVHRKTFRLAGFLAMASYIGLIDVALGNNVSTYLTVKIRQLFGMASNAIWLLGGKDGVETGGC
ncbi:MAG: hypothetical protein ACFHX7_08065 [Pseudomonadota bacterium]